MFVTKDADNLAAHPNGNIKVGFPADLVTLNPKSTFLFAVDQNIAKVAQSAVKAVLSPRRLWPGHPVGRRQLVALEFLGLWRASLSRGAEFGAGRNRDH